jgi:hypothetical protein
MSSGIRATAPAGFVAAPHQGQAFWFLNTLTITKVTSGDGHHQANPAPERTFCAHGAAYAYCPSRHT